MHMRKIKPEINSQRNCMLISCNCKKKKKLQLLFLNSLISGVNGLPSRTEGFGTEKL